MSKRNTQTLLFAGFTAVFVGYFAVWLPGPAAGLRFIGLEMGEWIKFLGTDTTRNWFYVPPITLGLMLAVLTVDWSNTRWQTWGMRGLAVAISLLSFPAFEDIKDIAGQFRPEYMIRIQMIGLVVLVVGISSLLAWKRPLRQIVWWVLLILGLIGAIGPTWYYLVVRPIVSEVLGLPVGIGLGVWLNGVGHLLVTAVALVKLGQIRKNY